MTLIQTVLYGFTKPMHFGLDGLAAYVRSGTNEYPYKLRILDRISKVRNTIRDLEKAFEGFEN